MWDQTSNSFHPFTLNAGFVRDENKTMPKPLTELFSEENLEETLQELEQKSETAFNELEISIKGGRGSKKRPGRQQSVVKAEDEASDCFKV